MIVFLFSLKMYDLGASYMSWLADLMEYALRASDPAGAKLVVDIRLDRVLVPNDSRLAEALSYTRVQHTSRNFSSEPLEEKLPGFAQIIAGYSTWTFYQRRDRRGFQPPTFPPVSEDDDNDEWSPIEQERGEARPSEPPPLARTPPAGQAGENPDWYAPEEERGLPWDAPAPAPSAPQPPAPPAPAPPSGAVGGLPPEAAPGGAPIPSPAPYPDQEQQERQDERKEASRQRGEAAPSAGDASTLQFSAYHPNTVAVGVWHTLIVYTYLAEALAQIQADAAHLYRAGKRADRGQRAGVAPGGEGR